MQFLREQQQRDIEHGATDIIDSFIITTYGIFECRGWDRKPGFEFSGVDNFLYINLVINAGVERTLVRNHSMAVPPTIPRSLVDLTRLFLEDGKILKKIDQTIFLILFPTHLSGFD